MAEGLLRYFEENSTTSPDELSHNDLGELYEQVKPVLHFVRYAHALYGKTLVNKWLKENKGRNLLDFLTDSDIEFVIIGVKNFEDRWLWEHTLESEREGTKPGLNFGEEIGKVGFGTMRINQAGRTFGNKARSSWRTLRTSTFWPVMRTLWTRYSAEYRFACHYEERSASLFRPSSGNSESEQEGGSNGEGVADETSRRAPLNLAGRTVGLCDYL